MVDFSEIIALGGGTVALIKGATETVKTIKDIVASGKPDQKQLLDSAVEALRDKLMELQNQHMTLQQIALNAFQQNMVLAQEKRTLEEKLTQLDKFEADRKLFERVPLALHSVAYREKASSGPADKQPLLCPNCFEKAQKTFLSFHDCNYALKANHLKCPACGTSVHVARNDGPAVASVYSDYDPFGG